MSTATSPLSPASTQAQPFVIEENSLLRKAIAYIPVLGAIFARVQTHSLSEKIDQALRVPTPNIPRVIELIDVDSDFRFASAVSHLLTVALVGAGIALEIISGPYITSLYVLSACGAMLLAGRNLILIDENNEHINRLRNNRN